MREQKGKKGMKLTHRVVDRYEMDLACTPRRGLVAACEARTRRKEPLQTACVCTRILRRMAAPIAIGLGPPFPKYICRKPHEFLYRYVQHDHNQFCDVEIISGRLFLPLFLPKGFANICIRNLGMGDVSKALT